MRWRSEDILSSREPAAFTFRALLLGVSFSGCIGAGEIYATFYLKGSYMAFGFSTVGAVFLFFLLTGLVNPFLKLIHPRGALNHRELLLVYIMMVMASPIPSLFTSRFLHAVTAPFYYASPENDWDTLLHYLPSRLMLTDPEALAPFYEGWGPQQPILWKAWLPLFLAWTPFVAALFLAMISTMALLRKQWVENERLIYPLVQVPLAMADPGRSGDRIPPFFKNPVMWAGFAFPALWAILHGLYNYFPWFTLASTVNILNISVPCFHNTEQLVFSIRFNILGFFYFLKTEVAFSLWFFNVLLKVVQGTFGVLGLSGTEMAGGGNSVNDSTLAHQSMGAMLVLVLGGLWVAREHLKAIFWKAFHRDAAVDDSGEILSYRTAVVLLMTGMLVMGVWLWLTGIPGWVVVLLLLLAAVMFVGFTRVVAEGGLSDGEPPVVPGTIIVSAVGSSVIGTEGLVALATTYFWTSYVRSFVMASCANSLKLGEELGRNRRSLFWAMLLALAVALISSVWMCLSMYHNYGVLNLGIWGDGGFNYVVRLIRSPTEPDLWGWINTGVGAVIMMLLMLVRWRYVWWPLHPLGYPVAPIWVMDQLWFSMFLAWLIKVLVLKYNGVGVYRKTRPFFLGMVAGHIVPGGIWLIIDHFTGMTGNMIFWG